MSKETWQTAIQHEIDFWKHYIETKGPEYPGDFENRMSRDTVLQENLHDCLPNKEYAMILDVGAGPMTVLGKRHPIKGRSLMITAVDPLAEHYAKIMADNNVIPPVTTEFAEAEDLQTKFKSETFDLVYCQNALDHSYDPIKGIEQMIVVVIKSGWVVLCMKTMRLRTNAIRICTNGIFAKKMDNS